MSDYIIGLTGGIASGKSTVDRAFAALGVFVADADVAARDALAVGSEGLAEVVSRFGSDVLLADGSLDRPAMRRRVFADTDARLALEAIVHPRVRAVLMQACRLARVAASHVTFLASAETAPMPSIATVPATVPIRPRWMIRI